ncbi:hypothetical protein PPS11_19919 [Pseudomonas putida S11]|nr:hypothetical protein PPS11_19919 [Pseudomonas putida S11]
MGQVSITLASAALQGLTHGYGQSHALICLDTASVEIPYRSCKVGSAPASRNASGSAIWRKVGVDPVAQQYAGHSFPHGPLLIEWVFPQ